MKCMYMALGSVSRQSAEILSISVSKHCCIIIGCTIVAVGFEAEKLSLYSLLLGS